MPKFSATEASTCMKNCPIPCERVRYSMSSTTVQEIFNKEICAAEYIISMDSFQYLVYTETIAYGFYNWVANMGGTLGIWLGIDITMCIEFFFTLKKWLVAFIRLFKKQQKADVKATARRKEGAMKSITELKSVY